MSFTLGPPVSAEEEGLELLALLLDRLPDVPTAEIRRALREGAIVVGGEGGGTCNAGWRVAEGEQFVLLGDYELERIAPARLAGFQILRELPDVLACFKPAGIAVEADRADRGEGFKAAILHHLQRIESSGRPRIVHRLDKGTSGVVLVALTRDAMRFLTRQFEERLVHKEYLAIVSGRVADERGVIERPLAVAHKKRRGRPPVEVHADGKPALTRWEVAERFGRHTLLRVHPETGRQHQIRVHLAAEGHPLAVDPLYGGATQLLLSQLKRGYRSKGDGEKPLLNRLSLHASRIAFSAPGGERVEVEATPPADLKVALRQLARWDPV